MKNQKRKQQNLSFSTEYRSGERVIMDYELWIMGYGLWGELAYFFGLPE
jgi:hypothetical protein